MNQPQQEQLSAFIDGELERDAARFLMKRLDSDAELREAWQRWQLVGSCLRGQPAYQLPDSFAEGIAARLANEATPRGASPMASVLRWTAGLAVAASVAMLALVVVQPGDGSTNAPPIASLPQAGEAIVEASPLRAEDLRPDLGAATETVSRVRTQLLGPALPVDPRLDSYLVRHGAVIGSNGSMQVVPYVHLLQAQDWSQVPARATDNAPKR